MSSRSGSGFKERADVCECACENGNGGSKAAHKQREGDSRVYGISGNLLMKIGVSRFLCCQRTVARVLLSPPSGPLCSYGLFFGIFRSPSAVPENIKKEACNAAHSN